MLNIKGAGRQHDFNMSMINHLIFYENGITEGKPLVESQEEKKHTYRVNLLVVMP